MQLFYKSFGIIPAGHEIHDFCYESGTWPIGHEIHSDLLVFGIIPVGHGMQTSEFVVV